MKKSILNKQWVKYLYCRMLHNQEELTLLEHLMDNYLYLLTLKILTMEYLKQARIVIHKAFQVLQHQWYLIMLGVKTQLFSMNQNTVILLCQCRYLLILKIAMWLFQLHLLLLCLIDLKLPAILLFILMEACSQLEKHYLSLVINHFLKCHSPTLLNLRFKP